MWSVEFSSSRIRFCLFWSIQSNLGVPRQESGFSLRKALLQPFFQVWILHSAVHYSRKYGISEFHINKRILHGQKCHVYNKMHAMCSSKHWRTIRERILNSNFDPLFFCHADEESQFGPSTNGFLKIPALLISIQVFTFYSIMSNVSHTAI